MRRCIASQWFPAPAAINTRLAATLPYNEMIKRVAAHYDAIVVDLLDAFALDPDGDGVALQEDFDRFQTYYYNDPHPNAAGFDVITRCFVDAILKNSKYIVSVETTAGNAEAVGVTVNHRDGTVVKTAEDYVTPSGMIVDYRYTGQPADGTHAEHYTAVNGNNTYQAEGGSEKSVETKAPGAVVDIPLTDEDDAQTEGDERESTANGRPEGELQATGDLRSGETDGIFDYTLHDVIKQGRVSVKTQSVTVLEKILSANHSGMTYVSSNTVATEDNGLIVGAEPFVRPQTGAEVPEIAPGYEYVYIGSDQLSTFWAAYAYNQPVSDYPDETPV